MRGALIAGTMMALLACGAGQAAGTKPTLTEVQKLTVQLKIQEFRAAQLQLREAQREAQRTQQELDAALKALAREGWQLDLGTWEYQPEVKK